MARNEVYAFVDGEMSSEEAEAFRHRLAESHRLQAELEAVMAFDATASVCGEDYAEVVPLPEPAAGATTTTPGLAPRHPSLPDCFSTESLERYVRGALTPEAHKAVQAHLPCERCDPEIRLLQRLPQGAKPGLFDRLTGARRRAAGDGGTAGFAAAESTGFIEAALAQFRVWVPRATAAAFVGIVVLGTPATLSPSRSMLNARVVAQSAALRGEIAYVGDVLSIEASSGRADYAELRVYAEGEGLVLKCPGDGRCKSQDGDITATLRLTTPGSHHVLWMTSSTPIAPSLGSFEADVAALSEAALRSDRFEVRPRE